MKNSWFDSSIPSVFFSREKRVIPLKLIKKKDTSTAVGINTTESAKRSNLALNLSFIFFILDTEHHLTFSPDAAMHVHFV